MFGFIFITLVSSGSAAVFYSGPCPKVQAMQNFNITAYATGTWYEISRYPTDWEYRGDCVSQTFYPENGIYKFNLSDVVEHHLYGYEGYMERAPNAGNTGLLNFISPAYKESEGDRVVAVSMLDTDYASYLVGYNCKYDEKLNMHHDFAWVMSRTINLDAKAKESVEKIISSFKFIDETRFIWIHFSKDSCDVKLGI